MLGLSLLKLMINDRTHKKNDANIYLYICFSLDRCLIQAIEDTCLGRKDPVLVTLSYRRKLTYHPLHIGFFYKLTSMQDVGHLLNLNVQSWL